MGQSINVNWSQVKDLGKRTLNNQEEFEICRAKLQEICNSVSTCWKGIDADSFITSTNNFYNSLKTDSAYLETWGDFFNKSSMAYSTTVEEGAMRVRQARDLFEEEEGGSQNEFY